tara:strand:- start:4979 stop:5608 length:630 start_codon:yes stop_codon:yes gene_type:complete
MSILRKNINALIESHKLNNEGKINKNFLMPLILSMIVNFCGIDQSKYHILASYGIRAIKQIGDLDINMEEKEWKKLEKSGMGKAGIYNNQLRYFIELPEVSDDAEMEIFSKKTTEGFPDPSFSHKSLQPMLLVDQFGHHYYHVDTLVRWKQIVHRDKDESALKLMHKEIKALSKENTESSDVKLLTLGLRTKSEIKSTLKNIEKILENW